MAEPPCNETQQQQVLGEQLQRAQSQADGTGAMVTYWGLEGPGRTLRTSSSHALGEVQDGFVQDSAGRSHGQPSLVLEAVLLVVGGWSGTPEPPSTGPAGILCFQQDFFPRHHCLSTGHFFFLLHVAPLDSFQMHPFQENTFASPNQMAKLTSFRNNRVCSSATPEDGTGA